MAPEKDSICLRLMLWVDLDQRWSRYLSAMKRSKLGSFVVIDG